LKEVRVRSGQIRVSVHGIDTETADTLWADGRVEASLTALPDVERQVTQAIASRLTGRVTSSERDLITKSEPRHGEAYNLVLRVRAAIQEEHWEPAEQKLRRAVELDPAFAAAHGWLAIRPGSRRRNSRERLRAAISHAFRRSQPIRIH
jgi:hypothetical protein